MFYFLIYVPSHPFLISSWEIIDSGGFLNNRLPSDTQCGRCCIHILATLFSVFLSLLPCFNNFPCIIKACFYNIHAKIILKLFLIKFPFGGCTYAKRSEWYLYANPPSPLLPIVAGDLVYLV